VEVSFIEDRSSWNGDVGALLVKDGDEIVGSLDHEAESNKD
jgi:hypothetical protein